MLGDATMQETLGLKLEPKKAPVEVIAIDHADRTPTDNQGGIRITE